MGKGRVIRKPATRANIDPSKHRTVIVYETEGYDTWGDAEAAVRQARIEDGKEPCPRCGLRWIDKQHACRAEEPSWYEAHLGGTR